jgi:hypothetical protein
VVVAVALGVSGARIAQDARIDALSVVALLVVAAFGVRLATQFDTSGLWISRISGLAVADRVVVHDFTVGIRTAVAWADAESVDTRFTLSTFRIGSAPDSWTNRWYTLDARIAFVSSRTVALGSVVIGRTESSNSARFVVQTRIDTHVISAGLVVRTVVIAVALRYRTWWFSRNVGTFVAGISCVTRSARAHRLVVNRVAQSVDSAPVDFASFDAATPETLVAVAAVSVDLAFRLAAYRFAVAQIVGNGVGRTLTQDSTQRQRVQNPTLLIASANVSVGARILAQLVNASQLRGTIRI